MMRTILSNKKHIVPIVKAVNGDGQLDNYVVFSFFFLIKQSFNKTVSYRKTNHSLSHSSTGRVRMKTIEDLRKLAELNLCKNCFQKYKAMIEPSMRNWLSEPLSDRREVESYITQIVMKTKGIFIGDTIIISFEEGEEEKVADEVDVKAFKKTKKWSFKRKIDYLYEKGILENCSYRLLDRARKVRNKIHGEPITTELSEQDYSLFYVTSVIASQIWSAKMHGWKEDISTNLKSNAEKIAKQWLSKINNL